MTAIILMITSISIPLIMLDVPLWVLIVIDLSITGLMFCSSFFTILISSLYYIVKPVLYIWALVFAVQGSQNFWAIAYYIVMGLQAPFMVVNLLALVAEIFKLVSSCKKQEI